MPTNARAIIALTELRAYCLSDYPPVAMEAALLCSPRLILALRVLLLASFVVPIASCNMVEGMGKDVGNAGQAIQDFAHNVKDKI